ncbi:hypothetical protein [Ammoniphilus resinae]|uniref:Uncharacterized protein n=1 Tax=Ammoniphilus resinae TaxID=861532 RepID=A0ABS4GU10_9BACL|nr:hypothetical protein [Ammoniphilus resinae]MBP1933749.1 hypothetical protein [Ammoniphilus resinae]
MFTNNRFKQGHRDGFRQGLWTAFLISSPFIFLGIKWMAENSDPVAKQWSSLKKSDLYTRLFDKNAQDEKNMNRKLDRFRAGEGSFGDYDVEMDAESQEMIELIKKVTKE